MDIYHLELLRAGFMAYLCCTALYCGAVRRAITRNGMKCGGGRGGGELLEVVGAVALVAMIIGIIGM